MNERLNLISKMKTNKEARLAYIKGKLAVLIPAQIRALRSKSNMPRQADLANAVEMQQSRISMFESPGVANFTIDTLAKLAAVFRVGLLVKFVPLHKMLQEENQFSQDTFDVVRIENDLDFLAPAPTKSTLTSKVSSADAVEAHLALLEHGFSDEDPVWLYNQFDNVSNDKGVIKPDIPTVKPFFVQNTISLESA